MADAFDKQLIGLLPNLRRFALSLARARHVADDLVQITCEKALANRHAFAPGTRMDAWLFRILRNAWIDQFRARQREGRVVDVADAYDLAGEDGNAVAESRSTLQAATWAIAELPSDQREVLVLVCVEGFSYREAADVLEIPVGTVMSRLARGRVKIAARLGIDPAADRSPSTKEQAE